MNFLKKSLVGSTRSVEYIPMCDFRIFFISSTLNFYMATDLVSHVLRFWNLVEVFRLIVLVVLARLSFQNLWNLEITFEFPIILGHWKLKAFNYPNCTISFINCTLSFNNPRQLVKKNRSWSNMSFQFHLFHSSN